MKIHCNELQLFRSSTVSKEIALLGFLLAAVSLVLQCANGAFMAPQILPQGIIYYFFSISAQLLWSLFPSHPITTQSITIPIVTSQCLPDYTELVNFNNSSMGMQTFVDIWTSMSHCATFLFAWPFQVP